MAEEEIIMPKNLMKLVLACAVLAAALAGAAQGQDRQIQYNLRDLNGVLVSVIGISEEAKSHGLSEALVKQEVENRLRQGGLKILDRDEWEKTPGRPRLEVCFADRKKNGDNVFAVSVAMHLIQTVNLERNPNVQVDAQTWGLNAVAIVAADELMGMQYLVGEYSDMFVADHKQANQTDLDVRNN